MKSSIENISLYAILIFATIVIYFEKEDSKPVVYAHSNFSNYNTESFVDIDNENNAITKTFVTNQEVNKPLNSVESNSASRNTYTAEKEETSHLIELNEATTTNSTLLAYADNQQVPSDKTANGPNNNSQAEEDITNLTQSSDAVASENNISTTSPEQEFAVIDKVAEISTQFAKVPAPPGGGGEDPFAVPIDDFYSLFILLAVSIVFGVVRMKKQKTIQSSVS